MNGQLDAALAEYKEAALKQPGDDWLVLEVTHRLLQHKRSEDAIEVLQGAVKLPGASGPVFARLGLVYARSGNIPAALQASQTAVAKAPLLLDGYQNLWVIHLQTGKPDEAFKVLNSAEAQTGAEGEFYVGLAELYLGLGLQAPSLRTNATVRALEVLRRAESLVPINGALRLRLADGFGVLGESQKASELYLEALETLPDVPMVRDHVHAKLAEIYLRSSDRAKALEHLEQVVGDNPTQPQAYYLMGAIALEDNQAEKAVRHFEKCLLLNPALEPAYYDLASALISLNRAQSALETLEKARQIFAHSFYLELLTAVAHSQLKNYAKAVQHFNAAEVIAAATDPKRLNHIFFFQAGATLERAGDFDSAERNFLKSLDLAPNFADALNYLGYMWADRGMHLERAREMLERAVSAEPKNGAFLDSLGWVHFRLRNYEKALEYLEKALECTEEPDPTLLDHLGDIYDALGDKEKARKAYRESLAIEPNDQVCEKLKAR